MCGRYTLRRINWYRDVKGMLPADFEEFTEKVSFNIAPSQLVPIITSEESGDLKVQKASWGFVPHWAKDKADVKLKPINAKGETVATSGMFRDAFKRRRCLIPADGFYEWQGAKSPKIPYFIHMRDDSVFCFGGIRSGDTMAIITTTPNAVLQPIHNRMPVIIAPQDYARWLGEGDALDMVRPYDAAQMEAYPVSTRVNNVRNQGPELIERT